MVEKVVGFVSRNKFNFILLIIWLVVVLFSLVHHELWRDEAQAWCVVRDLNIADIFKEARIEGHPIFWYLVLLPFAKMGLPVISMQIAAMLSVFMAAAVFIFKSPFDKFQKTIIVLSAGMLYFLPVAARNYALIPPFLFLLAILYPKRSEKPYLYSILIILLSNTHLLMLGFCLISAVLFSVEKLKDFLQSKDIKLLLPCMLLFMNFLILLLVFKGVQAENYAVKMYSPSAIGFLGIFAGFAENYSFPIFKNFTVLNSTIFYAAIFGSMSALIKSDKKTGLILFCSFSYFILMYAKVWFGGVPQQKAYVLFLILIFCAWVVKRYCNSRLLDISLNILFIISFLLSPMAVFGDLSHNFSGGKQTAEYIKNNLNGEDTFITIGYPYIYSSLSAYLPDKKLYSLDLKQYVSYFNFSKSIKSKKDKFPIPNAKYYIVQEDFILPETIGFKRVFASERVNISSSADREVFDIYVKEKSYDLIIAVD